MVPRPVPGGGSRLSLGESPDAKSRGGMPPAPPFLWPARWHSLVLALGATLFRSMGYYGAHVRALIWDAFSGRAAQPRGFPLGGKLSPKVTDEGAILSPTFPCRKIGLSPRRLSSPAPLGNPVAPSSAPVCALGHLPPRGEGFGGWRHSGLEPFFHKHAFQHIFPRKCVPNRSWHTGGNSPTIVPKTTIPKTSERE